MISFSLNKQRQAESSSFKRPSAFGSLDDEDTTDAAPTASSSAKNLSGNKAHIAQNVAPSKAQKKRMEEEKLVDSSVYEYDEVYDKMQEAKQRQKEAKEIESKQRKPKYIAGLLSSAATRRLDHLRAEEKMMQRERELEGDQFADKEAFVTQAYKAQMEEVRRAEEEEKRREEERKNGATPSTGMTHFYAQLLKESEQAHDATVAATQKRVVGPQEGPNLTIVKPAELSRKSDLELAKAAKEEGKVVELNDDNQIVDKRELLSAGLNLSAPNTRNLGTRLKKPTTAAQEDVIVHTAVGTAASRQEINARRAREVRLQMEAEQKRVAEDTIKAEREAVKRTLSQRNTEDDVQSARERYLARKRQKLEQDATEEGVD